MTDEEARCAGKEIYDLACRYHSDDVAGSWFTCLARAARELLDKREPVTREAVLKWLRGYHPDISADPILAALHHFDSAPAQVMEIPTVDEFLREMILELPKHTPVSTSYAVETCARVAHRLATTPRKPKVDADAAAMELAFLHGKARYGDKAYRSATELWNTSLTDDEREFWRRAVAKETGDA